jgi:hypothetical protein
MARAIGRWRGLVTPAETSFATNLNCRYEHVVLRIDPETLRRTLAALIGTPVVAPLQFEPLPDFSDRAAMLLRDHFFALVDMVSAFGALLSGPVQGEFEQTVMVMFLPRQPAQLQPFPADGDAGRCPRRGPARGGLYRGELAPAGLPGRRRRGLGRQRAQPVTRLQEVSRLFAPAVCPAGAQPAAGPALSASCVGCGASTASLFPPRAGRTVTMRRHASPGRR